MIDLHVHSTASDGSYTPQQIMALAADAGVKAISITDHDTIDGIKAISARMGHGPVELMSGVEISCDPPLDGLSSSSLHILGYGFSVYDSGLNQLLDQLKVAREQRNPRIVEQLCLLGFDISIEEVEKACGGGQAGRPHIAQVMVDKGYVDSFDKAFDLYLAKGKPAYVDKFRVSCKTAIQVIHDAGGVAVLAHPGLIKEEKSRRLEQLIIELISYGLDGLEVYYTDHSEDQVSRLMSLARQNDLAVTGGSDFHGTFNKGVDLGTGKGNLNIGFNVFHRLKARIDEMRRVNLSHDILMKNCGHRFKDVSLLTQALCHRSFLNENPKYAKQDNERLEFLGDAVLGLCIGQLLMAHHPAKKEGELSKLRSLLVSESGLADIARKIDLGRFIMLGRGERLSNGHEKNSILSDTFEALVAAIYLDAGFETVFNLIQDLFASRLVQEEKQTLHRDFKSALQEYVQETGSPAPVYCLDNESGPDHDKTFEVVLDIFDTRVRGIGKTKKSAEQDCARNALDLVNR
mgnify:CR=1 FL=1